MCYPGSKATTNILLITGPDVAKSGGRGVHRWDGRGQPASDGADEGGGIVAPRAPPL